MSKKIRGPNVWVVRHGTGYIVRVESGGAAGQTGATQYSAMAYARSLARSYGSELIVQNRHGQIRAKDSHGHDPVRTRG
jgi:hypothetical protein